jgi:hypothetical protein
MAETLPEQGQRLIWKEVGVLSDAKCRKDRDGSCVSFCSITLGIQFLSLLLEKGECATKHRS